MSRSDETLRLVGAIGSWKPLSGDGPDEGFALVTMTYGQVRDWTYVEQYKEATGKGFQRHDVDSHKRALRRAMLNNEYTPAAFSIGLHKSHYDKLKFSEAEVLGKVLQFVEITADPTAKFPLIDGNHRKGALDIQFASLLKKEDQAGIDKLLEQQIAVQVYLDPKRIRTSFLNLQRGRNCDTNLLSSMRRREKMYGDKQPACEFAARVASMLDKNRSGSFLEGMINFDGSGGSIGSATLTQPSSSSMALSLYGGAVIAAAGKRDEAWMAKRYMEVWDTLNKQTKLDPDTNVPLLLEPSRMLTPVRCKGGTRGATHFLIGIGNMLAWKLNFLGRDKASEFDLKTIATICQDRYDRESPAWNSADRRNYIREFAAAFFSDIVLKDEEQPSPSKVMGVEGVPEPLMSILSYTTFGLNRRKSANTLPFVPEDEPVAKAKPKRKTRKATKEAPCTLSSP
jgi:hypothetical protein